MSNQKSHQENSHRNTDLLNVNQLTKPIYQLHVKPGNTLCSSDDVLLMQDGSTTIEFRLPPKFQPKNIPWRFGLVRDIVWCSDLDLFILLTKDGLFNISPKSLFIPRTAINKPLPDFTIHTYSIIKPDDSTTSFWRCTCAGTTLYIVYSGYGTIIDEYTLKASSSKFVTRWTTPETCATYEGVWCIRYHPETDQLGFTIIDPRTDRWRMEIRSRDNLALLWQIALPLTIGACEISPLPNGEWLGINSCGMRLFQTSSQQLKPVVEYKRELRNAIAMDNFYIIIRTKATLEIHVSKQPK